MPNLGMRNLSTPNELNLIWKLGSPAITRSISKLNAGYNLPLLLTTKGIRLLTPSISGSVLTIPTPVADCSNSGILAIIPGYVIIRLA